MALNKEQEQQLTELLELKEAEAKGNKDDFSELDKDQLIEEIAKRQKLLDKEIGNAKSQRGKKQELQEKLDKIEADKNDAEKAKLKEDEDYKTLIATLEADNEALKEKIEVGDKYKEKYETYEKTRKIVLLDKLPEDKRTQFENLSLDVLEKAITLVDSPKNVSQAGEDVRRKAGDGKPPKTTEGQIDAVATAFNKL